MGKALQPTSQVISTLNMHGYIHLIMEISMLT